MDRKPAMIREPLEFICIYISYYILEREREREKVKKMQGWTTSDVKKRENLIVRDLLQLLVTGGGLLAKRSN